MGLQINPFKLADVSRVVPDTYGIGSLVNYVASKTSEQSIIDLMMSHDLYSEYQVKTNFYETVTSLIQRENLNMVDIKISTFILENYKTRLFYTLNHPTPIVFEYILSQILLRLNVVPDIPHIQKIVQEIKLDTYIIPVLPSVRFHLGLLDPSFDTPSCKIPVNIEQTSTIEGYIRVFSRWLNSILFD